MRPPRGLWPFHLLTLGGAAVLIARTLNVYAAATLEPSPESLAGDRTAEEQPRAHVFDPAALLSRDHFHARARSPTTFASCPRSTQRLVLIATLVADPPRRSIALITGPMLDRPLALGVGDRVLDEAVIAEIEPRSVRLASDKGCALIDFDGTLDPPAPHTAALLGARILGPGALEISRDDLARALADPSRIAQGVRVAPYSENGAAKGFRVVMLEAGAPLAETGLLQGDLIRAINGFELTSMDSVLEAYAKLRDAPQLSVDLVRDGKPRTLRLDIR
jgi:general secretion pathway protein C